MERRRYRWKREFSRWSIPVSKLPVSHSPFYIRRCLFRMVSGRARLFLVDLFGDMKDGGWLPVWSSRRRSTGLDVHVNALEIRSRWSHVHISGYMLVE